MPRRLNKVDSLKSKIKKYIGKGDYMDYKQAYEELKKAVKSMNDSNLNELIGVLDSSLNSNKIINGMPKNHKEKGE